MKMRSRGVKAALGCAVAVGVSGGALVAPAAQAQTHAPARVRSAAPRAATSPPALPPVNSWVYGWSAAIVAGTGGTQDRLIRVSPDGRTRDVGPVPANSTVVDVSHDARRIITKSYVNYKANRFLVWDSTTGGKYQITIPSLKVLFGPSGNLVSFVNSTGVVLRNRYGTPIKTYRDLHAGSQQDDVSPGGTTLSVVASSTIEIGSLTTGKVVRSVPSPEVVECFITGLWSDGSTKLFCDDIPGVTNTFTVSAATGAVTVRGEGNADLGQVVPTTPLVGTQYFLDTSQLFDVSVRPIKPVPLTGPWGSRQLGVKLLGGKGSSAFVLVKWQTGTGDTAVPKSTLVRKSLPSGATTLLAGSSAADGRRILSAYVVDGLN